MNLEEFYRTPRLWSWGGTPVTVKVDGLPTDFLGDDCTTLMGSWVQECRGVDPALSLRGTYGSAEEAERIVEGLGGIVALGDVKLGEVGCSRTDEPRHGDIGIVSAVSGIDHSLKLIPGICFGPLWIVMSLRGLAAKKLEWAAVAWRVH